jgi:hypothetical protein
MIMDLEKAFSQGKIEDSRVVVLRNNILEPAAAR